jgi:hypothetical protein
VTPTPYSVDDVDSRVYDILFLNMPLFTHETPGPDVIGITKKKAQAGPYDGDNSLDSGSFDITDVDTLVIADHGPALQSGEKPEHHSQQDEEIISGD